MTARCCLFLLAVVAALGLAAESPAADARPNIVFLIADDLGYGDVGCFGQTKIRTPHIDALARGGMRLTRCYAGNAVCAPSRCVLMTGMHPGHAQVRNNREVQPEGQHPLAAGTPTLARLLQQAGYATGGFGKWGLGAPDSAGRPLAQGFERWFGYNCQRVAHNHYPTFLWDNERRLPLDNPEFSAHQRPPAGADLNDPQLYAGHTGKTYAMDAITEQAVQFIRDNRERPFFLYYPTVIPHFALQVPADALAEYAGAFPETPSLGGGYLPHRTPRAAYAAMISRMDKHIGMLVEAVRSAGLEERTIFVFTSDNGPIFDRLAGESEDFFHSAAGFRGRKGSLYEGGVREPTIVAWKGQIPAGSTSDRLVGFEDWLPTLLELAGLRDQTPPVDGISLAPTLKGREQPPRPFLYREFPAAGGQQAVWLDTWKGIRPQVLPATAKGKKAAGGAAGAAPNLKIELYDLAADRAETTDVAAKHPEIVAQIEKIMRAEHVANPAFPFPGLD